MEMQIIAIILCVLILAAIWHGARISEADRLTKKLLLALDRQDALIVRQDECARQYVAIPAELALEIADSERLIDALQMRLKECV